MENYQITKLIKMMQKDEGLIKREFLEKLKKNLLVSE